MLTPQIAGAQDNLISNGGFDDNAAGWTLTGAAYANSKDGNPPLDVVLGPGTEAIQTINNLNSGTICIVSGNYGCSGTDTTDISFEVALNSVLFFETAVPTNENWNIFTFEYTAPSSSAVLSIAQTIGGNYSIGDYSIDNISMYAVPEPSAWALILLDGGVFIYVRTRKHHSA